MMQYTLRRLVLLFPVLIGIVLLVSMIIHIAPGDPVDILAGDYATELEKQELRKSLGLDQPWYWQATDYLKGVLRLDFGQSFIDGRDVWSHLKPRVLPTVELAIFSILLALLISLPLGVMSARRAGTWVDWSSMTFAVLGVAIPNFWLGPVLILLFSLQLGWLPVSERGDWNSYILPCFCLGTALSAILTRMTRSSFLENMSLDYVRTARAKGLADRSVFWKHVLKNSILPVWTIVGLQFGVLLTGSVITERIFDWPGLGTKMLEAIEQRDYPIVQACVILFSSSYVVINLLTDLGYALFDPRIRLK